MIIGVARTSRRTGVLCQSINMLTLSEHHVQSNLLQLQSCLSLTDFTQKAPRNTSKNLSNLHQNPTIKLENPAKIYASTRSSGVLPTKAQNIYALRIRRVCRLTTKRRRGVARSFEQHLQMLNTQLKTLFACSLLILFVYIHEFLSCAWQ